MPPLRRASEKTHAKYPVILLAGEQEIISVIRLQRICQTTKDQTGVRVLSHPQEFTQHTAHTFALNFAKVLSCFNVGTDRGENREWEVGNRSRYDDLDTKQSGTRLSMAHSELYLTLILV